MISTWITVEMLELIHATMLWALLVPERVYWYDLSAFDRLLCAVGSLFSC